MEQNKLYRLIGIYSALAVSSVIVLPVAVRLTVKWFEICFRF